MNEFWFGRKLSQVIVALLRLIFFGDQAESFGSKMNRKTTECQKKWSLQKAIK